MNTFVTSIVDTYEEQLKSIRHHLHEYPELSFEEYQTAAFVVIEKERKSLVLYCSCCMEINFKFCS